jgi:mono/diheme cytochrome c family protein/tetratricopeptide (TPR) repeat protein
MLGQAASALDAGAIYDAQRWLARSRLFGSRGGSVELMQVACYRHLGQFEHWSEELEAARRAGVPDDRTQLESQLGNIHLGDVTSAGSDPIVELIQRGVSLHEVLAAFVHGYLRREEPEKAMLILDSWSRDAPDDVHLLHMQGVVQRWLSQPAQAEVSFRTVLDKQPRFDLAQIALAQMLEEQNRIGEAIVQCVELAARAPQSSNVELNLVRLLRKKGEYAAARSILDQLHARTDTPEGTVFEKGQLELETGNYDAARPLLRDTRSGPDEVKRKTVAAILDSLVGDAPGSAALLAQVDQLANRSIRLYDVRVRMRMNPQDPELVKEFQTLSLPPEADLEKPRTSQASSSPLFLQHCAACHGENGAGNGYAARFLFPRPRNLRTDRFRLVSSSNGIQTLSDIQGVIQRGVPGTSMTGNKSLTAEQLEQLAREVQRMQIDGARERLIAQHLDENVDLPSEEEINTRAAQWVTPGEIVSPPQFGPLDEAAVARGKQVYFQTGCQHCHGGDGIGSPDVTLFDDQGQVTRPRDLVREFFKGSQEPMSIYLRIRLGMPGTPHPSCANLTEKQLIDLVHFCRSLAREPKRELTNHEREVYASPGAYIDAFSGGE